MVMRLSLGAYDQACARQCERDDEYGRQAKKDWGCDQDAAEPRYWIDCYACEDGFEPDDITKPCGHCESKQKVPVLRCPRRTATPELQEVVRYLWAAHHGLWPVAGGLSDQSATFVAAKQHFEAELARYEEQQRAQNQG